ncbi:hypothetical protein YC2023_067732 [Brassica napus]
MHSDGDIRGTLTNSTTSNPKQNCLSSNGLFSTGALNILLLWLFRMPFYMCEYACCVGNAERYQSIALLSYVLTASIGELFQSGLRHTGHALGYEKDKWCRVYKILRFAGNVHEIYALKSSDSWRVLDVSPDWDIGYDNHGVSLKGNTYWYAKVARVGFLLCFDFTRERFGQLLPLPFECFSEDAVILSSVGEEQQQLAVLFQHRETFEMEVWVTTNVEPDAVSWSMFFAVDMGPLTGFRFNTGGSFVVDEENAAVVVFDEGKNVEKPTRNAAYIVGFGESSYFREVDLGKITTGKEGFPHACSYVPSSHLRDHHAEELSPNGNVFSALRTSIIMNVAAFLPICKIILF